MAFLKGFGSKAVTLMLLAFVLLGTGSFVRSQPPPPPPPPSPSPPPPSTDHQSSASGAPLSFNPVNNIQISTCGCQPDPSPQCGLNCTKCDELVAIGREQLHLSNLILRRLDNNTAIDTQTPMQDPSTPRDCYEIQLAGFNVSGRYAIYPDDDDDPFFVYCDMDTDGGGWTVFQRRQDGSVDFYLSWLDYKYGFGNVNSEHWLGNDKIHRLTSQKAYKLRVDLEDFEGEQRYAEYDHILVADEALKYQLILGLYSGTAGDSLSNQDGQSFSTKDRDNDQYSGDCAQLFDGAWWYKNCHGSNLNGLYLGGPHTSYANGIDWSAWKGHYYSLKKTEMKLYPTI